MKKLITGTIADLREIFSWKKYLVVFAIIATVCYINYFSNFHFWLRAKPFSISLPWYYSLFFIFLFAGLLIQTGKLALTKNTAFVLFVSPLLFALKVAFPVNQLFGSVLTPEYLKTFHQPITWLAGVIIVSSTLLLVHRWLYGTWTLFGIKRTTSLSSYALLVLMMLPLLLFASAQKDFSLVYPRAKVIAENLGSNAEPWHYLFFETAYTSDFISIELFFRGFLIIVLGKALGKQCILPIALFYFSIHLGKPMFEAISSFFGGLILGAISYKSKSIWGGWMVHVSIALLMELFGFLF